MANKTVIERVKHADDYLNRTYNEFIKRKVKASGQRPYYDALQKGYDVYMACASYSLPSTDESIVKPKDDIDVQFALKCTAKAKQCIEMIYRQRTKGGTIFDFIERTDEDGKQVARPMVRCSVT